MGISAGWLPVTGSVFLNGEIPPQRGQSISLGGDDRSTVVSGIGFAI